MEQFELRKIKNYQKIKTENKQAIKQQKTPNHIIWSFF